MLEFYPYLIFRKPNYRNYLNINMKKTPEVLKCTFHKLETFSYDDFDRIVFIDLDTSVVKDIKDLFEVEAPFAGCYGYNLQADKLRHDMNSGVFIVNKPYLGNKPYKELLSIAQQGFSSPDQKTINHYFRKRITFINKKFNCEKRMCRSTNFKKEWNNRCVIHWVSEKPWQEKKQAINFGFEEVEEIWWKYYNMEMTTINLTENDNNGNSTKSLITK